MLNAAQTFYLDRGSVQNAVEASITRIDLFFKKKPAETNNKSGIRAPGVQVRLVPTTDSIPNLDYLAVAPKCYVKWGDIKATADASEGTVFRFTNMFPVMTNKEWAIVVDFDGDEDFELWTSRKGDYIVGTTQISPGPSGRYDGSYFTKITASPTGSSSGNNSLILQAGALASTANTPSMDYSLGAWRGVNDTDLKFAVYVARYTSSGSPWSNGTANGIIFSPSGGGITVNNGITEYRVPSVPMEYVLFDKNLSLLGSTKQGEYVFQNTVYYSHWGNGTPTPVAVTSNSVLVTAPAGMNFNNLYNAIGAGNEWIVIYSENHAGAGADVCAVRKVLTVQANNVLQLAEPVGFTNTTARFFKSPVASLYATDKIQAFGAVKDIMVMTSSNANDSVRFVNNTLTALSVNVGGTGYNNSDVLTVGGFENVVGSVWGGYPARANVLTNTSGGLVAVYMSNVGAGFVNVAQTTYTFANSTGGNSNGSGATFSLTTGAVLKSELLGTTGYGGRYSNCTVINLSVGKMEPNLLLNNPAGTAYNAFHRFGYFERSDANTASGRAYLAYVNPVQTEAQLINGRRRDISGDKLPMMPSRSNEFAILYENGLPCNATANALSQLQVDVGASNSSVILYRTASNNDFVQVAASTYSTKIAFTHFIYNNDYTNEHTNYGNSWAKQVTSKVELLGDGLYAEDLLVYVDAWRPANTDIQVYARIYNSHDGDGFDQKDWTRLEKKGQSNALFSSPTDRSDIKEFTFGFQGAPNTGTAYAGFVSTTLGQNTINGVGTTLNTLNVGDLVKIYQPLFPNNYMISVVGSVTNSTQIILTDPVSNAGIVGTGLRLESIQYKNQAFNNKLNQNVVRYYTTSMGVMDGFDTMQFKVLFLSSNDSVYPIYDDMRAVAVST